MSGAIAYTPRPGSKAEAAALELQARGELSTAELADALDCESGTLHALLAVPIKWGYLAREKRDGITRWRMGDGTPLPEEPDDDPPVQRIVSAARAAKSAPAKQRAPYARTAKPAPAKRAAKAKVKATPTPLAIASAPPPQDRRRGARAQLRRLQHRRAVARSARPAAAAPRRPADG